MFVDLLVDYKPAIMKRFLTLLLCIVVALPCFSQGIKTSGEYVNGKKEGLWTEYEWLYTWMDSTGESHVAYNLHFAPLPAYAEGFYSAGIRVGYWKTYEAELILMENDKRELRKTNLVSVLEYGDANSCSLYIEYYRNGNMKIMGQYQQIPVNRTDTVQIFDWKADPQGNIKKDTIVHTTSLTRPFGKWYYFRPDGSVKELEMAKLP